MREAVAFAKRTGFAMSQGTMVESGFGLGAVIPDADRTPHLAISIAAHAATVTDSLVVQWREAITRAIADGTV